MNRSLFKDFYVLWKVYELIMSDRHQTVDTTSSTRSEDENHVFNEQTAIKTKSSHHQNSEEASTTSTETLHEAHCIFNIIPTGKKLPNKHKTYL